MTEKLKFSTNWNNKLDCDMFTTIRLHSKKYYVGCMFDVELKGNHLKFAKVIQVKVLGLEQINEYIAGLDTGYSAKECKEMIQKIYSKYNLDWTKQRLDFILLKTVK